MIPIFKSRKDELKPYLKSQLDGFIFTELSADFLSAAGMSFLEKVPVPVDRTDLKSFINSGVSTTKIADNMALVLGSDTHFKYADKYLQYLNKLFDATLVKVFAGKAQEAFRTGNCRRALAYLRAGMMLRGEALTAMFAYACGCRYWYLDLEGSEEDRELIKILKSEAFFYFDAVTSAYPEFPKGWYYLGYAYVNAGQYQRAQLAWRHYLDAAASAPADAPAAHGFTAETDEDIKEIQDRLAELEDPVKLEQGAELLQAGHTVEALKILEPYAQTGYSKWWPLHFYLATAYRELGYDKEAIEGFLKVLHLSPSNADAMDALSELYARAGDAEKSEKYANKAKLVRSQQQSGS